MSPARADFDADLAVLTRSPHRLAGTDEGAAAAAYIDLRLRGIKGVEVLPLDIPVQQTVQPGRPPTLEVDGRTVELAAMRPNVVVPPTTPAGGITGPLLYAGRGALSDYGPRDPDGAVVVLDYGGGDGWKLAFSLGARAVVSLGAGDPGAETPGGARDAAVPWNLPRFYIDADEARAAGFDPTVDRQTVTLHASETWATRAGRDLVGFIPGTDAAMGDGAGPRQVMVVAAGFDTYGNVPRRSPGARGAANVAALLAVAERFAADPPRRDTVLLFLDAETRRHQGARAFYDAVMMPDEDHQRLAEAHRAEAADVQRSVDELADAVERPTGLTDATLDALRRQADWRRADLNRDSQVRRRTWDRDASPDDERRAEEERYGEQLAGWDDARRALHEGAWAAYVADHRDSDVLIALVQATRDRLTQRLGELQLHERVDAQREALRQHLRGRTDPDAETDPPRVVLHASLNLSDLGATWGPVAGGWSSRLYGVRDPRPEADAPGYYGEVLAALASVAERTDGLTQLDQRALRDPAYTGRFAAGRWVHSGEVAGAYRIYNLALVTGHDARPRDGHPADTVANLDVPRVRGFAEQAAMLLRAAADEPRLAALQGFSDVSLAKRVGYDGGKPTGSVATLRVSGGLGENRPAPGSMVALWPAYADSRSAFRGLDRPHPANYDPVALVGVDANGRFPLVGLRSDMDLDAATLGVAFGDRGEVAAISTQDTTAQNLSRAVRVDLFAGNGYGATWLSPRPGGAGSTGDLTVLRARSDTGFRENQSLVGEAGAERFFYLSERAVEPRVKLFEPRGVAALGLGGGDDEEGVPTASLAEPRPLTARSAADLWRLNEDRLAVLRVRGVTSPDLERLHAAAGRLLDAEGSDGVATQARAGGDDKFEVVNEVAESQSAFERSLLLSQRVYPTLRSTLDDLVYAVVALLLLSIPFAVAVERLLIGAASIYGRIAGFAGVFLVTFGLLYLMHPGFSVAATPIIIFLAFAILLLSGLVIYILVRKFQDELAEMQAAAPVGGEGGGEGGGEEAAAPPHAGGPSGGEVSAVATMMAAAGMGMSTMRRRPMRTTLTAVTVVVLTFTILCFASFTRPVGVRSVTLGPVTDTMPAGSVLVRQLDHDELPPVLADVLRPIAERVDEAWWHTATPDDDRPITVARTDDDRSATVDAVLGVDTRPPATSIAAGLAPALAAPDAPGQARRLTPVLLPAGVALELALQPGDAILVGGYPATFAGPTDAAALAAQQELDGQPVTPIDAAAAAANAQRGGSAPPAAGDELTPPAGGGEAIHLAPAQVAVAPNAFVQQLGGTLRTLRVYPPAGTGAAALGEDLARLLPAPVWAAGPGGVERLVLTRLTAVSGGLRLVVPLLLGGLIIFGTLLGSIQDRQKEVYTFSALGLAPKHVGVLFLAEAAVYAVVGGMGGQLLAQGVGLAASWLAARGLVPAPAINFSSTDALFAIGVVMATVMISAIYPAVAASRAANPGLARAWQMPRPDGDHLTLTFPFTVSAYDVTGLLWYLAEHFRLHDDAGLGTFAASDVRVLHDDAGRLTLAADLALSPFDLGVTQSFTMTAVPSEIPGVEEIVVHATRRSGSRGDWTRTNRGFLKGLRRQFLLWRTLSVRQVEWYRMQTLHTLGEASRRVA